MPAQEEQWSVALQKARHALRKNDGLPFALQLEHAQAGFATKKELLKQAVREKSMANIEKTLTDVIEQRAQITALELAVWEERYGKPSTSMLETYTTRYMTDCLRIITAIAHTIPG